ncbi:MAG TPA: hypothetical protein VEO53_05775, partial [Candidatus Binatia bacterium]|nr:hypothetical protein [Candidatus Binatia bacterium]
MSSDTPNARGLLTGAVSPGAPASRLSALHPQAPPHIPDHELLRRIGTGSYGEVWLARNIVGTRRAVKVIRRHTFDRARPYDREFAGIQKFEPISRSHDGLVDILQLGRNDEAGYFYYVMELADDAGQKSEVGGQRSEVGDQKAESEIANRKSQVANWETY